MYISNLMGDLLLEILINKYPNLVGKLVKSDNSAPSLYQSYSYNLHSTIFLPHVLHWLHYYWLLSSSIIHHYQCCHHYYPHYQYCRFRFDHFITWSLIFQYITSYVFSLSFIDCNSMSKSSFLVEPWVFVLRLQQQQQQTVQQLNALYCILNSSEYSTSKLSRLDTKQRAMT